MSLHTYSHMQEDRAEIHCRIGNQQKLPEADLGLQGGVPSDISIPEKEITKPMEVKQ